MQLTTWSSLVNLTTLEIIEWQSQQYLCNALQYYCGNNEQCLLGATRRVFLSLVLGARSHRCDFMHAAQAGAGRQGKIDNRMVGLSVSDTFGQTRLHDWVPIGTDRVEFPSTLLGSFQVLSVCLFVCLYVCHIRGS